MTEAEIKEKLNESREEILVLHKSVMMARWGATELPWDMPSRVKGRYIGWENRLIIHNVAIYKIMEISGYKILDNAKIVMFVGDETKRIMTNDEQQILFIRAIEQELSSDTAPPELKTNEEVQTYILEGNDMISYSGEIIAQLHLLGYQIIRK